jgi:hypothetical protein
LDSKAGVIWTSGTANSNDRAKKAVRCRGTMRLPDLLDEFMDAACSARFVSSVLPVTSKASPVGFSTGDIVLHLKTVPGEKSSARAAVGYGEITSILVSAPLKGSKLNL